MKAKDQDFLATNAAMTEKIFAGRENINIDDFYKLKHEILESLWHYEYYQLHDFETNDYKMKAEDFAKSLLIFMPYNKYNQYMAEIDKHLASWGDKTVSIEEYITF